MEDYNGLDGRKKFNCEPEFSKSNHTNFKDVNTKKGKLIL